MVAKLKKFWITLIRAMNQCIQQQNFVQETEKLNFNSRPDQPNDSFKKLIHLLQTLLIYFINLSQFWQNFAI